MSEDGLTNVTVRVTPEVLREIDAIVAQKRAVKLVPTELTRSSLIRYWVELGVKEARRAR